MTKEQSRICLLALNHYGVEHQIVKALEEMDELSTELHRALNDKKDGTTRTSKELIRGELADVMITCEQLRIIYGAAEVDARIDEKLDYLCGLMRLPKRRADNG